MCFLIVHKKIKSPETVKFQGFSLGGATLFIDEHLCKVSEQPLKAASISSIGMFLASII